MIYLPSRRKNNPNGCIYQPKQEADQDTWGSWNRTCQQRENGREELIWRMASSSLRTGYCHLYRHSVETRSLAQSTYWLTSFPPKHKLCHCDFIKKTKCFVLFILANLNEVGHICSLFSSSHHWPLITLLCVQEDSTRRANSVLTEERGQNSPGRNWSWFLVFIK